jgi:Glycosyl hydrolase family 99
LRRVSIITLVIAGILGSVGVASSTAQPDTYMTRVRFVVNSSSDWANVAVEDAYLLAYHVSAASPGAYVEQGSDGFDAKGPTPVSMTVDAVYWVPDGSAFTIHLAKGLAGEARLIVNRTNVNSVQIADLSSTSRLGNTKVTTNVARGSLVGEGLDVPLTDPRRLVLSFYYPWYQQGSFDQGMWHDKPTGPYDTSVSSEVGKIVSQAAGAGIDGFLFSWDGQFDYPRRFDMLLAAAQARGNFWAAPLIEMLTFSQDGVFDVAKIESVTRSALARAGNTAFLRAAGRPVIFLFGASELGAANWNTIRQHLASSGLNPFVVGDAIDESFGFDGFYQYNPNGMSYQQLVDEYSSAAMALRLQSQVDPTEKQRLWAATASPGMNDFYLRPFNSTNEPRDGGARYDLTWDVSLSTTPEWVLVNSWNEFYEATHISPSEKYGAQALDQTRAWSYRFKHPTESATDDTPAEDSGGLIQRLMDPLSTGVRS